MIDLLNRVQIRGVDDDRVRGTAERLSRGRNCPCATALAMAIVTDRSLIPAATREKLGPLVAKYL